MTAEPTLPTLDELLQATAALHSLLCPRQVLGVRMGLAAGLELNLTVPRADRRLVVIVETDGCFADGVATATGCGVGRRTLRIEDLGKVAATFVDVSTEKAVRIAPRSDARNGALRFAGGEKTRWRAQLLGYQRMPLESLLEIRSVALVTPIREIIGQGGSRAVCHNCGEEILNQREVIIQGGVSCRACAGRSYYRLLPGPIAGKGKTPLKESRAAG